MTFDTDGYEDLRTYIKNEWGHFAIVDTSGSEITRIDISADGRAQWLDTPSTNPMTADVTIKGSDSDVSTPAKILRGELYKSASATKRMTHDDAPTNPTLEAANDEVTLTIDVELPNV